MAREMLCGAAINAAMSEEMRRDKNVYLMGEDVGKFGGCFGISAGMYNEFGPERVIDTPISEGAGAYMAIGAAVYGKRPIYELMFGDFVSYTYAPICLDAATLHYVSNGEAKVPIVFRGVQGGFINSGVHHSNCVEGWVNNIPGLTVIAPSTAKDYYGLLKSAIRCDNPILFLENKVQCASLKGEVPDEAEDYTVPIGVADVVREGTDITIVAWQFMRQFVEMAVPELEKLGISVELIDPRTIKPFDFETLEKSVEKTGRLMIVHEHVKNGGVGEYVASKVMTDLWGKLKAAPVVMGREDIPIPWGGEETMIYPNPETIIKAAAELAQK